MTDDHTDQVPDNPTFPVAVAPHRLGGGYLFVPGELLVETDSFPSVSDVLGSVRFRLRVTWSVITQGFFARDLEFDEVGLQQGAQESPPYDDPGSPVDLPPGPSFVGDSPAHEPAHEPGHDHSHDHSHGGEARGRARHLLGAIADTLRFLWTVKLVADLKLEPEPGSDALDRVRRCRLAGLRQVRVTERVVPVLLDRLSAVELNDRVGPLVAGPNHVSWPSTHMSSKSAVPPSRVAGTPPVPTGNAGKGVTVALLDIGVDANHPWFTGSRVVRTPGSPAGPYPLPTDRTLRAYDGHGTFLAGLVLQQAPAAQVLDRRVLNPDGFVDDVTLAGHIRAVSALPAPPAILVLALAGPAHRTPGSDLDFAKTKSALADYLAKHPGSVVVAAAGNEKKTSPFYPAAFGFVTGVAAYDGRPSAGKLACFTNRNATTAPGWVDVCVDGVAQVSSFIDTKLAEVRPQEEQSSVLGPSTASDRCAAVPFNQPTAFNGFARWSGSSMSTAILAGKIAAAMTGGKTARQALDGLAAGGTAVPYAGVRI